MRKLGDHDIEFPERGNKDDLAAWSPRIARYALAPTVLAVARTRIEGAWAAYVGGVAGDNHEAEYPEVLLSGNKLPEVIAREMFPIFDGVPYAR